MTLLLLLWTKKVPKTRDNVPNLWEIRTRRIARDVNQILAFILSTGPLYGNNGKKIGKAIIVQINRNTVKRIPTRV